VIARTPNATARVEMPGRPTQVDFTH